MDKKELILVDGKVIYPVRGGSAMFDPDFIQFRFYDDDNDEANSTPLENQGVDHTLAISADTAIQLRCLIQNQDAADGTTMDDFDIEYNKNGGGVTALTTTDNGDGIRAVAAGLTNDAATTDRASNGMTGGSGTFVAGEQSSDGVVDDSLLTASNYTHHAYGIEFVFANLADTDVFDFTFSGASGVTNTATPQITLSISVASFVDFTGQLDGAATVEGNIQGIKQADSDLDANAIVDANIQGIKQVTSDLEANAFIAADLEVEAPRIDLAAALEANAKMASLNYLDLPGSSNNNATTPDSVALSIIGDIDLRAKVSFDNASGGTQNILSKMSAGNLSYRMMLIGNTLYLQWSDNGTTFSPASQNSGATGISDNEIVWLRATLDVDNGATGHDAKFYKYTGPKTNPDASDFTQIGTTKTGSGVTNIFDGTHQLEFGIRETIELMTGNFYRSQIYNGIDGTLELDANFSNESPGTTSFTEDSSNAATITINQSGSPQAEIVDGNTTTLQVDKQLSAAIDASATVDADIQGDKQLSASVEGNATVEGDLEVDVASGGFVDLDASIEANATVEGDAQVNKQLVADLEAAATVDGNAQVIKQIASDLDADATMDADLEVEKVAVLLAADLEGNATLEANSTILKQTASDLDTSASIESNAQIVKQSIAELEGNATIDADLEVSSPDSLVGTASVDANIQIIKQIVTDLEGNATLEGDLEVDLGGTVDLAASIQASATLEASLTLIESAVEEVTRGGYLPPEEMRKLLKIRRDLDRKVKKDRERKDDEKREQKRELERIFNQINGIEEVSEELAEIIEPFVQAVPETAEALESQPQLPSVNFEALAAQAETANRLRQLADRLDQINQDEEDAITLLLLV